MKITIESVRDEVRGPIFHFYGDVDPAGLHSFSGTADDLDTAFDMAKECIEIETEVSGPYAAP